MCDDGEDRSQQHLALPPGRAWYFAYGSNNNKERLFDRRLKPEGAFLGRRLAARLDDYALTFDVPSPAWKGTGVGNIRPASGAHVWGVLNEIEADRGFDILDKYECVSESMYRREKVKVWCEGGTVEVICYVGVKDLTSGLKPAKDYLAHFMAGRDVLPAEWVVNLEKIDTIDVEVLKGALHE